MRPPFFARTLSVSGLVFLLFGAVYCTPPTIPDPCAGCKGYCLTDSEGARRCVDCKPGTTQTCSSTLKGACGDGQQTCNDFGVWGGCNATLVCKDGERCLKGKCLASCDGLTPCNSSQQRCTTLDGKPAAQSCQKNAQDCWTWGAPKACSSGERCTNGQCQAGDCPAPPCKEGEKRCEQGEPQLCKKDNRGCLRWEPQAACSKGQRCVKGLGCVVCEPGSRRDCYSGPAGTQDTGPCKGGKQSCKADGSGYDACKGEVTPAASQCNGKDNDCDGRIDCPAPTASLNFLRKGLTSIGVPGLPGTLIAFGGKAFPVVAAKAGEQQEPVAVAALAGKGRVMAFGHGGYLDSSLMSKADTGAFLQRVVRWLAGQDSTTPTPPKVLVLGGLGIGGYLQAQKFPVTQQRSWTLPADLSSFKVLILRDAGLDTAAKRKAVTDFVNAGGGVLVADTPWGWAQIRRKDIVTEMGSNLFLTPLGLAWTGNYISGGQSTLSLTTPVSSLLHGIQAQELLVKQAGGQTKPSTTDVKLASHTLLQISRWLASNDTLFLPRLQKLLKQYSARLTPTASKPIKDTDGLLRALMALQLAQITRQKPADVKAHPAASTFPGAVASSAKRIKTTLSLDLSTPRWHSTGLYAAPGEVITLTLTSADTRKGLSVRIGAHKDKLWHKDKWQRVPEISRSWALKTTTVQVASAFGGLLYIEVPTGRSGKSSITVQGAVQAPLYVAGKTTLSDWKNTLRKHPAPWAELANGKLILTVPSSVVRALDAPDKLMAHWDKVMDACADLAVISRTRKSPERVVMDQQISAGYMHAGYPIMTHLDVKNSLTSYSHMSTKGGWGIYHELGHNHQSRYWTFSGTTEVTVNLFTLYIFHTIHNNFKPRTNIYGNEREKKIRTYLKAGAKFSTWQKDPFLALIMYMQLQEAFGWKTFKQVFDEYHKAPSAQLPKTDAAERDQWMVRFSKRINKNLGPFFQAWGVPTSAAARQSISSLPKWMPAGFPPKP